MKVLNILSQGYRATLEEQDDTVLWISQVLRRSDAEIDLLLRNSAVNYVVEGQRVEPLAIGGREQRNAPDVHAQLQGLVESGADVFVVDDDLRKYGLADKARLNSVRVIGSGDLPSVMAGYDQIWHW